MNKMFSFMAGALAGSLVGAVTALLLTPTSGEELQESARARWEYVLAEAKQARDEKIAELEAQYEQLKRGEQPTPSTPTEKF